MFEQLGDAVSGADSVDIQQVSGKRKAARKDVLWVVKLFEDSWMQGPELQLGV